MYIKRRTFRRRPKDILSLALRNLLVGEHLTVTQKSYDSIRDRYEAFKQSRQDLKFQVVPNGVVKRIRRVA